MEDKKTVATPTTVNPVEQKRNTAKLATAPVMNPHNVDPIQHLPNAEDLQKQANQQIQEAMATIIDKKEQQVGAAKAPTRKPGAKVYSYDGRLEHRRRLLGNLGLSDMVLPPLTRNTVATYRIIHKERINPSTKQPVELSNTYLPGQYLFHDIGEKDPSMRNKLMKNLTGRSETVRNPTTQRDEINNDVLDGIDFHNGLVKVDTSKQFIKYVFLELHPLNKSNRFRDRGVVPIFERTDIKTERAFLVDSAELDLALEAEQSVIKMDRDRAIGIAAAINVNTMENGKGRRLDEIKYDLRVFARNNPKQFFKYSGNAKAAIRINMIDLKALGLIEYDVETKHWYDFESEQKIHAVAPGEDPLESLITMLSRDENQASYEDLVKLLNYWDRDDLQLVARD